MREGLKNDMRHIHALLKHRDRWYLDVSSNVPELQDICEEAKGNADYELSKMSINALYCRYVNWRDEYPQQWLREDSIRLFLSDISQKIASSSLDYIDRLMFDECCTVTIKFN